MLGRYNFTDLLCFNVVNKLSASGVSPLKVKAAIRELRKLGMSLETLSASRVVICDKSVYKCGGKGDPFRMTDGQQAFGFILDLSSIHTELVEDVQRMAA